MIITNKIQIKHILGSCKDFGGPKCTDAIGEHRTMAEYQEKAMYMDKEIKIVYLLNQEADELLDFYSTNDIDWPEFVDHINTGD